MENNPVLMRMSNDCEIAAIATATGKTYEEAEKAFWPLPAIDPVRGNPLTSYNALIRLGFWKRNITWADLVERRAEPGKTVILVHDPDSPYFRQHWIVLAGYSQAGFRCFWGYPINPNHNAEIPVEIATERMQNLFLKGWPNCAYQILPLTWWQRFKRWLGLG